jgi:hypothetical protein
VDVVKKVQLILCLFLLLGEVARGEEVPRSHGTVYFDRGHYWIELTIHGITGESPSSALLDRESYEITRIGESRFRPSRVEILDWSHDWAVLLLSSGKLKGRDCYSVTIELDSDSTIVTDPFCDPFYYEPGSEECSAKGYFRRYVAPAFGRSGDGYSLNRFKYEYELDDGRGQSALTLEPSFEISGWGIELSFDQHETVYEESDGERSLSGTRSLGIELARSGWIDWLGYRLGGAYRHERSRVEAADGDFTLYGQDARITAMLRFDNLFDALNRHCTSVFKGVDAGFGYAWYVSGDEEVWGEGGLDSKAPLMLLRFTWTILYGLQFSYALESTFPSETGNSPEEFHTVKFRLLLRDVLEREDRRSYHPDLEFLYESGRRIPLFENEKKVTVGFTFDLFPW